MRLAGQQAVDRGRKPVNAPSFSWPFGRLCAVLAFARGQTVIEFRVLGPFEVVESDRPVAVGGPKQRALLAVLVFHRGEVVSSDRLIDELWGERPPATAAKTLQAYVSRLRKALGSDVLVTRDGGYALAASPGQLDADRFETMVADGRLALAGGDPAGA